MWRPIVVDASSGSWVLIMSPFLKSGRVHDGAAALPEREDDDRLLPRVVRLRLGHWGIGGEDFVPSWATRSSALRPLKKFSIAP